MKFFQLFWWKLQKIRIISILVTGVELAYPPYSTTYDNGERHWRRMSVFCIIGDGHYVLRKQEGGGPRVVVSTAAFHARVRGSVPHSRVKVSIVESLRDREVACSASDRQGSNFESCVWRTVSSHSSHHPQEVLLAQFSLYVHKSGLKPDSFNFVSQEATRER